MTRYAIAVCALLLAAVALSIVIGRRSAKFPRPILASSPATPADKSGACDDCVADNSADFLRRCNAPGVVRCWGFDTEAGSEPHINPPWGESTKLASIDHEMRASGSGALRFTIPSLSGQDSSGSFWLDFSDNLAAQFGEGQEFYIQWRQRFSPEFLKTPYKGDGWKQVIVGEGSRPGHNASSCTQLELVVVNTYMRGVPQMYHSCGGKDGHYEGLQTQQGSDIWLQNAVGCQYGRIAETPCVRYKPDQWMTFQMHVKIGTWYKNDQNYHHDSTVQLWVAEQGKPSKLVIDFSPKRGTGYDLANTDAHARYGKIWLLPYNTNKDPKQENPQASIWYDDLIISRSKISDPQ